MRSFLKPIADRFNSGEITHAQFLEECRKASMAHPLPKIRKGTGIALSEKRSKEKIAQENRTAAHDFWDSLLAPEVTGEAAKK